MKAFWVPGQAFGRLAMEESKKTDSPNMTTVALGVTVNELCPGIGDLV